MGATLKQLVMEGDNKAYDDQRWNLLQWVLGATDGFLATVRTIPQAKKIRVAVIALHFILAVSMQPIASFLINIGNFRPIEFHFVKEQLNK